MFKKLGIEAVISLEKEVIAGADKLILPGVGSFDAGMANIDAFGLRPLLADHVLGKGKAVLGICLGMQLLTRGSEEGQLPGLGFVEASTQKFRSSDKTLKVPHMGWNTADVKQGFLLWKELPPQPRFYFVHSYHVVCQKQEDVAAVTHYGYDFVSAFVHKNIMGVQFHPEKSHQFGMRVLKNFAEGPC
jgi:glutamine amidotransferase